MHFHPDQLHQLAADRQGRLRSEAAAHRLAGPVALRTRLAYAFRRAADRFDATGSPCSHVGAALPERG
jgi:hypothetical protein